MLRLALSLLLGKQFKCTPCYISKSITSIKRLSLNLAPDKPLKDEDFSRAWSCEGKSSAVTEVVQGTTSLGCCGVNGKSACWKNYSYVCLDPADYDGSKEYTYKNDDGTTGTSTCDAAIASNLAPDKPLKDEDFSRAWSCEGKSSAVTDVVQGTTSLGCCGANRKSACWVDRSNVCADPSKFLPWNNFKSEDGSFDGTCDFAVHAISDDNMDSCYGEDFSKTWSCSGKSSPCQAQLLELARGGCCGSAGQSASACHGHYSGAGSFTQVGIFAISMAVAIAIA